MVKTSTDARVPTVVLYDIMREAATRVGGAHIAKENRHPEYAARSLAARIDLTDRVNAVDVDDRAAIVAFTEQLRTELDELHGV